MAGCPWLSTGQKPCGAWPRKYATAISPARMKATGRVNSPTRSNRPPNVSRVPAIPGSDMIGAVPPPGMMAAGNAKILAVPNCMKRKAATIRSTLKSCGARVDQLRTRFDAVMVLPSVGSDSLRQALVSEPLRTGCERVSGPAPFELVYIAEQGRIGAERRQVLEQQRPVAAVPQHRRGEPLDGAVLVQQPGRGDRADPRDARISVGRVAHESQEVGNQRGLDAELLAHPCRVADLPALAIDLDDAIAADALRQIFVGGPDADLLYAVVLRGDPRRGGERVVGLELGHGPHRHAHGGEGVFERVELREQGGVDALTGLVIGPERVAKRLDDVVGGDAEMRRALLDHLQYRVEHSDHGAEGRVLALCGAAAAVELAEQLVRAVDQMNDHAAEPRPHAAARARSRSRSRALRVSPAARSNSARASSKRPSLNRKSPRTVGSR